MKTELTDFFLASLGTFFTASGVFFAYVRNQKKKRDSNSVLLMGLAHHKIVTLGLKYVDRGWISHEEYQDFYTYLYEPYKALGGNGTAVRIIHAVDRLPLKMESLINVEIRKTDVYGFDEEEIYEGDERRVGIAEKAREEAHRRAGRADKL